MHQTIRKLSCACAIAGMAMWPQAHASTVIDFEGGDLTGIYYPGDSFTQNGFLMTVDPGYDFGTIDVASGMLAGAPTGNATQFYFNSNDGGLIVERAGGGTFSLDGFSAAFVPLDPPSAQTTVIVAVGVRADSSSEGLAWLFGSSATSNYPFQTYNNPADFTGFNNLALVEFYACSFDGSNVCASPTLNNGQFAIDNILVTTTPVPEPATYALTALGLLGLLAWRRRGNH